MILVPGFFKPLSSCSHCPFLPIYMVSSPPILVPDRDSYFGAETHSGVM